MPCEHCVSRRDFLASAAGAAALSALSACGDGDVSGLGAVIGRPTGATTIVVGDYPDLATNDLLVGVFGQPIAVKRTGPTTFEAFWMRCTHQGCTVDITNGVQFDCPCHFSRFSNTGAVLKGPAKDPLPRMSTSYNGVTDVLTIEPLLVALNG